MSSKLLFEACKATLEEYLNKTSINGCYLLYKIRRQQYQRLFWSSFIVMTVTFTIYVCYTVFLMFIQDPTVTTLDFQKYSVDEAPFPSVAICSCNKFSREAIRKYALNITIKSSANESLKYWENRLELLSGIYNYDSVDFDEANKLHYELESIHGETFKTGKILKMLAPLCEDLIVKCFWAGGVINCKENFELMMFIDGPCCVFNYQYMKNVDELLHPNSTGKRMGLTVMLNASTADYFYAEDSAIGFHIKLFSNQRMPDISMGEMEEFHVDAGQDVNVRLDLVSLLTSEDTRVYGARRRGCYFPYENEKASFALSECLLTCKIRYIENKCECRPFYAFKSDNESGEAMDECSLLSLGCFDYYKYKLFDFSNCSDCYPLCSYNHYYFRLIANGLKYTLTCHDNAIFLGEISNISQDLSLVKIYYSSKSATRYNKKPLFGWYHIISNIGGVIGIGMGCSLINGVEIIYFGCFRWLEKYKEYLKNKK